MARSKHKPSSVSSLKKEDPNLEDRAELILKDFRISKILSERFLSPEAAKIGTFSVFSDAKTAVFPENLEVSRSGMVSYNLSVTGYTRVKGQEASESKEKSFSIEIEAEGRFETVGAFELDDEKLCATALRPIILLIHALCIHHARAEADSMGYRTVRPDYQVKNMPEPTLEAS